MAIINERWPRDLCPESCTFTRTRNDVAQRSPRTRQQKLIRMGRPLWTAQLSWTRANNRELAKLRYWLESLDGMAGSVQIWNFASPHPLELNRQDLLGPARSWEHASVDYVFRYETQPYHWRTEFSGVTLTSGVSAGATVIPISGLQPNSLVTLQGQYVQIDRRLYLAATDSSSNSLGAATIFLQSPLLTSQAAGTTVRLVEAACEMQLADQNWPESARAGEGLISVSATFIETVSDLE